MRASDQSSQRPLIVWCAGASWSGITGTDRQMALAMTRYADVLWVDPPLSPVTPLRYRHGLSRWPLSRLAPINASLTRFTPAGLPFHSRGSVRRLTAALVRVQIRRVLARMGRSAYAVIASHLDDVLGTFGSGVLRVFYGTDDYVGGAELMGTGRARLEREELRQLGRADMVIAISSGLAERWRGLGFGGPLSLIPNGVEVDRFRDFDRIEPARIGLPKPIAGFVGHLSSRIDINLLEEVVGAGNSLLLVGPHDLQWEAARFKALISNPRVAWTGPIAFDQLPPYLKIMDVGITPYADSTFNRASFPLKTLEYLSAGKPVVSTDLPAVRWLETDLIAVAGPGSFGAAVRTGAETDDADLAQRRMAFAGSHSWKRRAEAFAKAIALEGQ